MIGNTKKNYDGVWRKNGGEEPMTAETVARSVMNGDRRVAILDGPSGCGKTHILRLIRESNAEKTVTVMSARDIMDELLPWIVERRGDARSYAHSFADTEVLCIEDTDMSLLGKEATQCEISEMVQSFAKHGMVILTGIDVKEKVPVLYDNLASLADVYTFTEK